MLLDEGFNSGAQLRQMELDGLTAARGKGIQAGDSRVEFVERLADGFARPAKVPLSGALAQTEAVHGVGHEAAAVGAVQGGGGVDQQGAHGFGEFHRSASGSGEAGILCRQLQKCTFAAGRGDILKPP